MSQAYLLVEGVNIYPNVLDTDQLSVIRGSSFILKRAIDHIKNHFNDKLKAVTTGASSGLFLVTTECDINRLVVDIAIQLEKSPHRYFTFAIEHCHADDLLKAKEQLHAQLRFNQMGAISVVPDHFDKNSLGKQPCELEGRRIASKEKRTVQGATRTLSASVCDRLNIGRKERQSFYFNEGNISDIEVLKKYGFTDDLEALSKREDDSKLNNKMAVIYLDGNKFSDIQRTVLNNANDQLKAQTHFDDYVKGVRANFLKETLLEMIKGDNSRFPNAITKNNDGDDIIRLETLLWGGDEMLFVVPAWLGFELLQSFFQASATWQVDNEKLTHAAGIVFCSTKTPIRIIREIAQSLADNIKNKLGEKRKKNSWDYMVLESIDYPITNNIDHFNQERYGNTLATCRPKYFSPAEGGWTACKEMLNHLVGNNLLTKRQLYKIVESLIQQQIPAAIQWCDLVTPGSFPDTATAQDKAERRMLLLLLESNQRQELMDTLPELATKLFGIDLMQIETRAWFWLNLIELWDYLVSPKEED